jgi:diguanylate cyclase (GGDEF)-like protein
MGKGQGSPLHLQRAKALLLLGVLAICGAVWFSADTQRRSAAAVAARQRANTQLLLSMIDQETALRGYLLTGGRAPSDAYRAGQSSFRSALADSQEVEHDPPGVAAAMKEQVARATAWQEQGDRAVAAYRAGDHDYHPKSALERKIRMDAFRAANLRVSQLLERRGAAALDAAARVPIALIILISGVFGGAGYVLVVRRFRAEERLDAQRRADAAAQLTFTEDLALSRSEQEVNAVLRSHVGSFLGGMAVRVLAPDMPGRAGALRFPLLAGSEDLGHVEIVGEGTLTAEQRERVQQCIAQASPALENRRNLARAERRAATDALTGLPNARSLDEALERMVAHARRGSTNLAAVMLDLDHFKRLNDTCGHDLANDVLAAVGRAIGETIRASDFAARFGGEEFTLLLPDTDAAHGVLVGEKVRSAIAMLEVPGVDRAVTASVGVAAYPADAATGEELLRAADRALYMAKRSGRNRVEAFVSAAVTR